MCFQRKDGILNIWINNVNFYHFLQFTVGKPELINIWLNSKQRSHELTVAFLWLSLPFVATDDRKQILKKQSWTIIFAIQLMGKKFNF